MCIGKTEAQTQAKICDNGVQKASTDFQVGWVKQLGEPLPEGIQPSPDASTDISMKRLQPICAQCQNNVVTLAATSVGSKLNGNKPVSKCMDAILRVFRCPSQTTCQKTVQNLFDIVGPCNAFKCMWFTQTWDMLTHGLGPA